MSEEELVDKSKIISIKDLLTKKLLEYDPKNIFNCDKQIIFKCPPSRTGFPKLGFTEPSGSGKKIGGSEK